MSASFYTYFHTRNDTGKVFYVGKGKGRRAHEPGRNHYWRRIVAKHGRTVHFAMTNLSENEAFEHERFLISCFKGVGVELANMTDGGEGVSGWVPSLEFRRRVSEVHAGKVTRLSTRAKIGAANKTAHARPETREKMRVIVNSPDIIAKTSAVHRGKIVSPETRAKHRAAATSQMANPLARLNLSVKLTGLKRSEEFCEQHRISQKKVMSSPEVREKLRVAWVRRKTNRA